MVYFTVEEENLVCVYYKADRHRTIGRMTAALPDMDGAMQALARRRWGACVNGRCWGYQKSRTWSR